MVVSMMFNILLLFLVFVFTELTEPPKAPTYLALLYFGRQDILNKQINPKETKESIPK